jgi:hypothetical protein
MHRLAALFLTGSLAFAAPVRFDSPRTLAPGAPFQMAQGDFNGDQKPDLLVSGFAETGGNSITLYTGIGHGQFSPGIPIYQAQYLKLSVTGDFNHDGKLDVAALVSPISGTGTIAVLLGNGDGTFQAPITTTTQNSPQAMIAGDFNHDGNLDLAVAGLDNQLQIFLGNGDGTFAAPVVTALTNAGTALAAADFNGDGKLDIAVGLGYLSTTNSSLIVLLGNGDGTFQAPATLSVTGQEFVLATADVNGDHIPDLVVGQILPNSVQILLGKGDGTFQPPASNPLTVGPQSIVLGDANGDGELDVIVGCLGQVSLLAGNGDGTFQAPINSLVGTDAFTIVAGDYNGDRRLDVAFNSNFEVVVALGDGAGHFQQPTDYKGGRNPGVVAVGDFTADGIEDIVVANNNALILLPGKGNGQFGPAQRVNTGVDFPVAARVGDFNHDGIADVVTVGSGSAVGGGPSLVQTYFGQHGGMIAGPTLPLHLFITSVTSGDFNSDGNMDLAFAYQAQGRQMTGGIGVLLGKADGSFQLSKKIPLTVVGPGAIVARDFNGDGKTDLAVENGTQLWVFLGDGAGGFQGPVISEVPIDTFLGGSAADLNGDGKMDLVLAGFSYSQVYVLLGNGDGTFQPAASYPSGRAPYALVIRDFNCDGKLDLATANYNENDATIMLGNGDGSFQPPVGFLAGSFPTGLASGDFQGNGKSSLVVANNNGGTVTVLLNTTRGTCP